MVRNYRVECVSVAAIGLLLGGCGSDDTSPGTGTGGAARDASAEGGSSGRDGGRDGSTSCACAHGTCTGGSACICDPGYIGALCDTACPCVHGTCGVGGACTCDLGFTGATCSTCAPQHYGATCQACSCGDRGCSDGLTGTGECSACPIGFAGTSCTDCATGYFGSTCQPCTCVNGTCNNGTSGDGTCSTCQTGWTGANCTDCTAGYWGATCQVCPSCGGHGACNDGKTGDGGCTCSPHWTGATCGECAPGWAGTNCDTCAAGYWGTNCDQACACKHGACDSTSGHCSSCDAAWSGTDCDTCTTCQNGLLLYWKFDEASGTTAFDSTANHFDGTYVSDLTLDGGIASFPAPSTNVPAAIGTASDPNSLLFTINSAYREAVRYTPILTDATLKPANNFTISAWFRAGTTDPNGAEILSMGDNYLLRIRKASTTPTYQLQYSKYYQKGVNDAGSPINGYVDCQGPALPASAFLDGVTWHHFAATQSSTTGMAMYLDGTLITLSVDGGTSTCANPASATNTADVVYVSGRSFWVGRNGNTSKDFDYDGNIDEVRIYNRVLSAAEILTLAEGAL